jgi:regulatory protein
MSRPNAWRKALQLLSRRDHFRRELEEKLRRKGYRRDEVEAVIERCEQLDLIDDERVAERFVDVRAVHRGWGPHRLAAELRHRGVDDTTAERLSRLSDDMAEKALRCAVRKTELRAPDGWWQDGNRRARMVSSLVTRGFDTEIAIAAVDELAASRENQQHALDDQ